MSLTLALFQREREQVSVPYRSAEGDVGEEGEDDHLRMAAQIIVDDIGGDGDHGNLLPNSCPSLAQGGGLLSLR